MEGSCPTYYAVFLVPEIGVLFWCHTWHAQHLLVGGLRDHSWQDSGDPIPLGLWNAGDRILVGHVQDVRLTCCAISLDPNIDFISHFLDHDSSFWTLLICLQVV